MLACTPQPLNEHQLQCTGPSCQVLSHLSNRIISMQQTCTFKCTSQCLTRMLVVGHGWNRMKQLPVRCYRVDAAGDSGSPPPPPLGPGFKPSCIVLHSLCTAPARMAASAPPAICAATYSSTVLVLRPNTMAGPSARAGLITQPV
jgi:hypothetical protein